MNKSFLDLMYVYRGEIVQEIHKLYEQRELPLYQCCDNMPSYNPVADKISMKESELFKLDSIIQAYININR